MYGQQWVENVLSDQRNVDSTEPFTSNKKGWDKEIYESQKEHPSHGFQQIEYF